MTGRQVGDVGNVVRRFWYDSNQPEQGTGRDFGQSQKGKQREWGLRVL